MLVEGMEGKQERRVRESRTHGNELCHAVVGTISKLVILVRASLGPFETVVSSLSWSKIRAAPQQPSS